MGIQRKVVTQLPKRQQVDLIEKHMLIGELLQLDVVPTHTLAWKEPRLELSPGECYPIVDVLLGISKMLDKISRKLNAASDLETVQRVAKRGRPKKAE